MIVSHAGACAADWSFDGLSGLRRRLLKRLPLALRVRAGLGLGRSLVGETIGRSRVVLHMKNGRGSIDIRSPLFEYLREPSSMPMRRYYAAAYTECLRLCDVDGVVDVDEAGPGCRLTLSVRGALPASRGRLDGA